MRDDLIKVRGTVTSVHGQALKVRLPQGGMVLATPNGKMKQFLGTIGGWRRRTYFLVGDLVDLELSPYDLTRGFVAWRHRPGER
jgi:translation initiation factor IF-1